MHVYGHIFTVWGESEGRGFCKLIFSVLTLLPDVKLEGHSIHIIVPNERKNIFFPVQLMGLHKI